MTVDQLALFSILRKESSAMMYDIIYSQLKKGEKKLFCQNRDTITDGIGLIYEYSMNGKTGLRETYLNIEKIFCASDLIASLVEAEDKSRIDRILITSFYPDVQLEDDDIKILRLFYIDYAGDKIDEINRIGKEKAEEKLGVKSIDESMERIASLGIIAMNPI